MYMVGGGNSRVQRGCKPYPGATRWMTPSKPVRQPKPPFHVDSMLIFKAAIAIGFFAELVIGLNFVALWLS